jgi:hypothetical protein
MFFLFVANGLLLLGAAAAAKWPLRAPHAADVPASFDCAMRKAAYAFGRRTLPRKGAFESLYYALDLDSDDCLANLANVSDVSDVVSDVSPASSPVPADAVYVAVDGDDRLAARSGGTRRSPFKTIQAAADHVAATKTKAKTVVLRGGTHYLAAAVQLTARHSHIHFRADPRDAASSSVPVVSGGVPLKISAWKPYNVTGGGGGGRGWRVLDNQNAVYGAPSPGTNSSTFTSYGRTPDAGACAAACKSAASCDIYTWHDPHQGVYANQCYFRLDGDLVLHAEPGHTTGYNTAVVHGPDDRNIWVADIGPTGPGTDLPENVPGLLIDGKRATRARYPNIPGGIETSCGYGCMVAAADADWTPPQFNKYGNVTFYTDNVSAHTRPNAGWFEHYMVGRHGLCSVYDPPVSYWCSEHPSGGGAFAFRTPSGVTPRADALPNAPYASADEAVFFVWRPARWANWMFYVDDYDPATGNFTFGHGGNQGARGSNQGGDWFVENVMEELDFPGEFFHDKAAGKLYLYHNGTGAPSAQSTFVVPQLRTLVNVSATQWNPATDIKHTGITFVSTRTTYMDAHGVPSAGDWALVRNGAIFLQGTEGAVFDGCTFDRLDGNGVMVSGYNRNATVTGSDFSFIGGNAVAAWGYTNETETDRGRPNVHNENWPEAGVDGTDGEHPLFTTVTGCTAREVGLYEKQSSFFVQAKTARSVIKGNVFFNGPRAGINANDGFGGGDEIAHNLVFSSCRESGDHGPFNSWDRQPFLTTVADGKTPSMDMAWREIHHNFFIDNYSPQEDVDNDDGSRYYHTHDNFLVYGGQGMKNDFGGHDNHHFNNIYGYVGQGLGACSQLAGHEDFFYGNKVVMTGQDVGRFTCSGAGKTVVHDNAYFTPDGTIQECNMDLPEWQKKGEDKGSSVARLPKDEVIIGWAKELLGF